MRWLTRERFSVADAAGLVLLTLLATTQPPPFVWASLLVLGVVVFLSSIGRHAFERRLRRERRPDV